MQVDMQPRDGQKFFVRKAIHYPEVQYSFKTMAFTKTLHSSVPCAKTNETNLWSKRGVSFPLQRQEQTLTMSLCSITCVYILVESRIYVMSCYEFMLI